MRLIDADELEQEAYEMFVHARTPGAQVVAKTVEEMVKRQPTVEQMAVVQYGENNSHIVNSGILTMTFEN